MRNAEFGTRSAAFAALVLALSAGTLHAQPPAHTATVTVDRNKIRLWESVQLTLAVEGPAPMRSAVEFPKQLLTDDADKNWRIRPKGEAEVTPLPGGRERWRQTFRLDPHAPGKPLRVAFAPITVHGKPFEPPAAEVTVERTGAEGAPLPESLPVTTVEDLPPPPVKPVAGSRTAVVVSATVAVACAVLFVVTLRRARRPKPLPPGTRARDALAKLEAEHLGGADVAERVADILRRFVERRHAIPATKLTTSELYEALSVQGWAVGDSRSLRELLDACDLAKFAGAAPDFEGCARLIQGAREWLNRVDPVTPTA